MSSSRNHSSLQARAVALVLALAACTGANVAEAREGQQARRGGGPRMVSERGARQAERAQQRAMQRQAQERPPEAAPVPAAPPIQPPPAKPGRLTPDERRALRQQINDAGRDLYRPGRP